MQYLFKIDNELFDDCATIVSLTEKFDILSGKNSGRTQDGGMYIEALGTFFNYTVTFKKKNTGSRERWDTLKNILAQPQQEHTISILRDQGIMDNYRIYVSSGQRELLGTRFVGNDGYENDWGDLTVDFVAMEKFW